MLENSALSVGHKTSAPGPWVAHPCCRVLEKRTYSPLSEGCCSRTPGFDSDIGSVGTSGVAVTMLEPTNERVAPTTLGITAIEIELDQVHTAIAFTTSTLSVV